ncbi:MAG TPA: hypothetical protein VN081_02780 [Dongiaceae bacterium]|nr:hypothetical protein [Dongiaceae bacterium]
MTVPSTIPREQMIKLVAAEIARLGAYRDQATGYKAALNVRAAYPELGWDTGQCMIISEIWQTDPELQREIHTLREERGEVGFSWTKREFLEELKNRVDRSGQDKDKLTGMRLFADVAGFMPKDAGPTVNVQTNVGIANNVMRVPTEVPLDEWEIAATRQQDKLIEHASGT